MSGHNSLVSVVIPTFNRAQFIIRAIRSVLAQSYENFEIIVVDDASQDDTIERVLGFDDMRMNLIRHSVRKGAQAARNSGLRAARGDFLAFLDSDDEWMPEKLAQQIKYFERGNNDLGVVSGICIQEFEDNSPNRLLTPELGDDAYTTLLSRPEMPTQTMLIKRECFEIIGELDETIRAYQEWDLSIRLAKHYRYEVIPEILAIYHIHMAPTISKDLLRSGLGYLDVIEKHRGEIERVCGRSMLSGHYLRVSYYMMRAGNLQTARENFILAIRLFPLNWRLWAYFPVIVTGPKVHRFIEKVRDFLSISRRRRS